MELRCEKGKVIQSLLVEDGKNTYLLLDKEEDRNLCIITRRNEDLTQIAIVYPSHQYNNYHEDLDPYRRIIISGRWIRLEARRIDGIKDDIKDLVPYSCDIFLKA